jgi:hypothetical protein
MKDARRTKLKEIKGRRKGYETCNQSEKRRRREANK